MTPKTLGEIFDREFLQINALQIAVLPIDFFPEQLEIDLNDGKGITQFMSQMAHESSQFRKPFSAFGTP